MRKRTNKKINLRTIAILVISILFLIIGVGYSYLKQSLNIVGKSEIVVPQSSSTEYKQGNSTYSWTIDNTYGTGTPLDPYVFELKITVVNMDEDITTWEMAFDIPDSYNDATTNIWDASSRIYENGRLTIVAQTYNGSIPKGETYTLSFQLAFDEVVDLYIENFTLNGYLATYEE